MICAAVLLALLPAAVEMPALATLAIAAALLAVLVAYENWRFAELRIRESEQRLRDIIDTAQDWIWELAAGGRYVFSSESVRGMLGLSPDDLNGTHFSDYIHEEDALAVVRHGGQGAQRATGAQLGLERVGGLVVGARVVMSSWTSLR